jgi:hypothetical protein
MRRYFSAVPRERWERHPAASPGLKPVERGVQRKARHRLLLDPARSDRRGHARTTHTAVVLSEHHDLGAKALNFSRIRAACSLVMS